MKQAELLASLRPPKAMRGGFARPPAKISTGIALAPDETIFLAEFEPSAITKLVPLDPWATARAVAAQSRETAPFGLGRRQLENPNERL